MPLDGDFARALTCVDGLELIKTALEGNIICSACSIVLSVKDDGI